MEENIRYSKAVNRNLYEIAHALFELKALTVFEEFAKDKDIHILGQSFFNISNKALFNDMIAHTIKVLEINEKGDSVTFWYIWKENPEKIEELKSYSQDKINQLKVLAEKLKIIRDKTHFHIDKNGVLDPDQAWNDADIKSKDLIVSLQYLFSILYELYELIFMKPFLFHPDDYDGRDLTQILNLASTNDLIRVTPKI